MFFSAVRKIVRYIVQTFGDLHNFQTKKKIKLISFAGYLMTFTFHIGIFCWKLIFVFVLKDNLRDRSKEWFSPYLLNKRRENQDKQPLQTKDTPFKLAMSNDLLGLLQTF